MIHSDASYGDILMLAVVKCQPTDERGQFSTLWRCLQVERTADLELVQSQLNHMWPAGLLSTPSVHYTVILYHHRCTLCGAGEVTVAVHMLLNTAVRNLYSALFNSESIESEMQQAGRFFTTRFIMIRMRGFAIYRTSKVDGGEVLMWSCVGRCSLRITTSSPLWGILLFVSWKIEREKNSEGILSMQRKDDGHNNVVHSRDHWFTLYYNASNAGRLCMYECYCHVFAFVESKRYRTWDKSHILFGKKQLVKDCLCWNAFLCKYETDVYKNRLADLEFCY